jgi:thymidylate synthase (FAD)
MSGKLWRGYENVAVDLVDYDRDVAKRNWYALRTTWRQLHDVGYDPDNPKCIKMIRDLVQGKVFGTFLSTAHLTFFVRNISRICLAQITRDTGCKFASESNMPNPLSHQITVPKYIYDNPEWLAKLEGIQAMVEDLYDELTEAGVPFQDSRYVGIHGQQISITISMNLELLQKFCKSRLNPNTHDEILYVYKLMKKALREQIETDHESGDLDDLSYFMWKTAEARAEMGDKASGKVSFFDPMFGNSFDVYPNDQNYTEPKPMFDYRKLSLMKEYEDWYDEQPGILLPEEKAMVERWRQGIFKTYE